MTHRQWRRVRVRPRTMQVALTVSSVALLVVAAASAKSPTHPLVPGSLVIAETTYPAAGDPAIGVGRPLSEGGNAIADGKYPEVFNNDTVDASFAVSTPIDLLDVDSLAAAVRGVDAVVHCAAFFRGATAEEAHAAYVVAAHKYFGEFARDA